MMIKTPSLNTVSNHYSNMAATPRFGAKSMSAAQINAALKQNTMGSSSAEEEVIAAIQALPEPEQIPILEEIAGFNGKMPNFQSSVMFKVIPNLSDEAVKVGLFAKAAETKSPTWVSNYIAEGIAKSNIQDPVLETQAAEVLKGLPKGLAQVDDKLLDEMFNAAGQFKNRNNKIAVALAVMPEGVYHGRVTKNTEALAQLFPTLEDRAELLLQGVRTPESNVLLLFNLFLPQERFTSAESERALDVILQIADDSQATPIAKQKALKSLIPGEYFPASAKIAKQIWAISNAYPKTPSLVRLIPFLTSDQQPVAWLKYFAKLSEKPIHDEVCQLFIDKKLEHLSVADCREVLTDLFMSQLTSSKNSTAALMNVPARTRQKAVNDIVARFKASLEELTGLA